LEIRGGFGRHRGGEIPPGPFLSEFPEAEHLFRLGKRHPHGAFMLNYPKRKIEGSDDQRQCCQDHNGAGRPFAKLAEGEFEIVHGFAILDLRFAIGS
jgi:hypothetical protein